MSSPTESTEQKITLWTRLPVVLASASPRRAEILRGARIPFTVRPVVIDEESLFNEARGESIALVVARAKAEMAWAHSTRDECVLAADTVVLADGAPLGKPSSPEEAREMLLRLRGRSHDVVTGLSAVVHGAFHSTSVKTRVTFREYSSIEIDDYIRSGAPMDKAGAYGIQDLQFSPADNYSGCYLNVVGLPVCGLVSVLKGSQILPRRAKLVCEGHRP